MFDGQSRRAPQRIPGDAGLFLMEFFSNRGRLAARGLGKFIVFGAPRNEQTRSLALVPDSRWQENRWRWVHEGEPPPRTEPVHVILLKPGQTHEIHVDFGNAYWFVTPTEERGGAGVTPTPLRQINPPWGIQFRLVYRPPEREVSQDLPNSKLIWHGRLPSRAFTPAGSVD